MANLTYEEGQIFEGKYPPEAAIWCNENNCHIEEVASQGSVRVYKIVKNVPYVPTKQEILNKKEAEYGMSRWQREGILAENSQYSEFAKARAQELEDLAEEIRQEQLSEQED